MRFIPIAYANYCHHRKVIIISSQSEILCNENPENFVELFNGWKVNGAGVVPGCVPHAWEGRGDQVKDVDSWKKIIKKLMKTPPGFDFSF